jgi:hypothetical protein
MNVRYRIFKFEQACKQIPDGLYQTNYSAFTLSQTGYQSDFETYEAAVTELSETVDANWSEYTILPVFNKV